MRLVIWIVAWMFFSLQFPNGGEPDNAMKVFSIFIFIFFAMDIFELFKGGQ